MMLSTFSYVLCSAVAILFVSLANANETNTPCLVPNESDLLTLLLENGGIVLNLPEGHTDEKMSPHLHTNRQDAVKVQETTMNDSNVIPEDWHCPVGEKPRKGAPPSEASTCPWRFALDQDPKRYPATLFKAVRRCSSCLGADGSVLPGTSCVPVTYPTKVLRQRGCEPGGVMKYDVEDIQQTVAYQCIINDKVDKKEI